MGGALGLCAQEVGNMNETIHDLSFPMYVVKAGNFACLQV